MSRGVIYLVHDAKSTAQAERSMASLWAVAPGTAVLVLGTATAPQPSNDRRMRYELMSPDGSESPRTSYAPAKTLLARVSPFEESLFVEANCLFESPPTAGFAALAKWDVVVSELAVGSVGTLCHADEEVAWTAEWLGSAHVIQIDAKMLLWRQSSTTKELFSLWIEESRRFSASDERLALLRALLRSEAVYQVMPHTWTRPADDGDYDVLSFGVTPSGQTEGCE